MAESYEEYLVSKDEYNAKINELNLKIDKAKNAYDDRYRILVTKRQASSCAGIRGWRVAGKLTECQAMKNDGLRFWENERHGLQNSISSAQNNLDKYIHSVREAEKQKQIDDIKLAIREAVEEEERRIAQEAEQKRLNEIQRLQDEENARIEKERLQEEARLAEIESRKINFQLTKGTEAVGMTTLGLSPFIIGGAVLYLMSRKGKKK